MKYEVLAATDSFDDGIRQVVRVADEHRVALMCSEKEPLDCHRTLLIGRALVERGVEVAHILANGNLEGHDATIDRLLAGFKLPFNGDMLSSREEMIANALSRQSKRVGYVAERALSGGWRAGH